MEKPEVIRTAVGRGHGRGRTWHRRLSSLIRKHPRETILPAPAPTPPRASSAPPSRIAPSTRTATPDPTGSTTHTEITETVTTPQERRATELSAPTPSTGYDEQTESIASAMGIGAPVEVMKVLEYAFRPVELRPLMVDLEEGMEGGLGRMCRLLAEVSQGTGVIGASGRYALRDYDVPGFSRLAEQDRYFSSARDELGHTPSVRQVRDILMAGKECQKQWHNLNGWHLKVHFRVLSAALHPPDRENTSLPCNYMPCATANIIKRYRPHPTSLSASPAFCLYLDPTSIPDPIASARLDAIRRFLPHSTMNHLDYAPLRRRPLAVSIATTDPGSGQGLAAANLRMASWHAAQWNFLAEVGRSSSGEVGLEFLPGVVVEGHEWSFMASTREGTKTVLWTKQYIGSTNSILGIYQVATVLQILAKWSLDVFWPWYRRTILEFSPDSC
ncbi:uncharacterized protein DNG_04210 [Cephalotrichum gorgonifer]|uniref:PD-(D/E)XK nuclease-like domain-containing protein n=1 Tax=Cephalotrichum gorgonifer TaxID=2041049 RepID=A0AAE8MY43_9PEZI|nr:uncharacterized protein DNG_04210 [Cephalotrichum gorgonifer]